MVLNDLSTQYLFLLDVVNPKLEIHKLPDDCQ